MKKQYVLLIALCFGLPAALFGQKIRTEADYRRKELYDTVLARLTHLATASKDKQLQAVAHFVQDHAVLAVPTVHGCTPMMSLQDRKKYFFVTPVLDDDRAIVNGRSWTLARHVDVPYYRFEKEILHVPARSLLSEPWNTAVLFSEAYRAYLADSLSYLRITDKERWQEDILVYAFRDKVLTVICGQWYETYMALWVSRMQTIVSESGMSVGKYIPARSTVAVSEAEQIFGPVRSAYDSSDRMESLWQMAQLRVIDWSDLSADDKQAAKVSFLKNLILERKWRLQKKLAK